MRTFFLYPRGGRLNLNDLAHFTQSCRVAEEFEFLQELLSDDETRQQPGKDKSYSKK